MWSISGDRLWAYDIACHALEVSAYKIDEDFADQESIPQEYCQ